MKWNKFMPIYEMEREKQETICNTILPGNESKKHKRKLKKISVSVPDYVDKLTKFNRYCLQGRDPEKYYKGR